MMMTAQRKTEQCAFKAEELQFGLKFSHFNSNIRI